jgi:hypothetical protein
MPRNIDLVGRLTKISEVDRGPCSMILSGRTYQRVRRNSQMYGDSESYEEIITRLLNFYEKNNRFDFINN